MPSAQLQGLLRLPAQGDRAEALQEPVPTAGDPTEREPWTWHAPHLRLCPPSPHKAEVRRELHTL